MPEKSGRINETERSICARVKTIRQEIRWPQAAFAEQLGITRDQLASIECGRTPVRYDIAWRISQSFGISLRWLVEGDALPDSVEHDNLPEPAATGLPARVLLSQVVDKFRDDAASALRVAKAKPDKLVEKSDEISHRWIHELFLKLSIEDWIARLPDGTVSAFTDDVFKAAEKFLNSLPKESMDVISRRADAIMWHRIRTASARKSLTNSSLSKKELTEVTLERNISAVKSPLTELIDRVRKAASKPGMKANLAKFLNVPAPRVSEWLRENNPVEPNGETTLKLLQWVEQQERK